MGLLSSSFSFSSCISSLSSLVSDSPPPNPNHLLMCESKKKKKKKYAKWIKLVSTAGTGFFYVVSKTKKLTRNYQKLELKKYDPRVNRHVLFIETKLR